MSVKLSFITFFLFAASAVHSQNVSKDSTKITDSAKLQQLSFKMDEIISRLKNAEATDKEFTGIISYDTLRRVRIYTKNGKPTRNTIKIEKVSMLFRDGYIVDIQIFSKGRIFTNRRGLISINSDRFSADDKFWDALVNKNDYQEYIYLQEALTFVPFNSFFPEDRLVNLTDAQSFDTLYKNVGINSVLDLRLYTDALAALGNEANGIFQTDLRLKQFLHRLHYRRSGIRIFQYMKVNFTASKLDSKNAYVNGDQEIKRTELLQKSKISSEVLVNIYTSWLGRKTVNTYFLDAGGGINIANLSKLNTVNDTKDTVALTVPMVFLEGGIDLKNSSNVGFEFLARYIWQYSPQTDFSNKRSREAFLRMGAEIYWNPFKDVASRVFGRVNYTTGLSTNEKKNSYLQAQIGYSTLLSKALGKK